MNKISKAFILLFISVMIFEAFTFLQDNRPTIYLIGDSTVKNSKGRGDGGLWGWGSFFPTFFDTTKVRIVNSARGGTSSRTYQTQLWKDVFDQLKPGDYVIMQFGHNDGAPLADSTRNRGTIKGIGDESKEVYNIQTKQNEVVHSYGWYMRKYITDTKSKGATPIVCSSVPRNVWKNGISAADSVGYCAWAEQVAKAENVMFIPLNQIIVNYYNQFGETKVKTEFFTDKDHTHTIEAGARFNAGCVVEGIRNQKDCKLNAYLLK